MADKYFLQMENPITGTKTEPEEVTKEQYIQAERLAGVYKYVQNHDMPATGAFTGPSGLNGWTEYIVE